MCKSNSVLCIVIYIPHKELDFNIREDSCVYWERSVALWKCSLHQPSSLWLCGQVSFQSIWSLDHWNVKQHLKDTSPIQLISFQMWNSSLDYWKGRRRSPKVRLNWLTIPWSLGTLTFSLLLSLHHALPSLLWLQLWIHAQDQHEEL